MKFNRKNYVYKHDNFLCRSQHISFCVVFTMLETSLMIDKEFEECPMKVSLIIFVLTYRLLLLFVKAITLSLTYKYGSDKK